jgi:hypothetical protein
MLRKKQVTLKTFVYDIKNLLKNIETEKCKECKEISETSINKKHIKDNKTPNPKTSKLFSEIENLENSVEDEALNNNKSTSERSNLTGDINLDQDQSQYQEIEKKQIDDYDLKMDLDFDQNQEKDEIEINNEINNEHFSSTGNLNLDQESIDELIEFYKTELTKYFSKDIKLQCINLFQDSIEYKKYTNNEIKEKIDSIIKSKNFIEFLQNIDARITTIEKNKKIVEEIKIYLIQNIHTNMNNEVKRLLVNYIFGKYRIYLMNLNYYKGSIDYKILSDYSIEYLIVFEEDFKSLIEKKSGKKIPDKFGSFLCRFEKIYRKVKKLDRNRNRIKFYEILSSIKQSIGEIKKPNLTDLKENILNYVKINKPFIIFKEKEEFKNETIEDQNLICNLNNDTIENTYLSLQEKSISFHWGLGIGDWGLGIGPNPQSPIPNPQSPSP